MWLPQMQSQIKTEGKGHCTEGRCAGEEISNSGACKNVKYFSQGRERISVGIRRSKS